MEVNDQDGLQISLGSSASELKPKYRNRPIVVFENVLTAKPIFSIFVHIDAWYSIQKHVISNLSNEVGGVLVGSLYHDNELSYIEIANSVQANHAIEKKSSITFTHKTWTDVNEKILNKNPETQIVGWYHSHPGYGIFLSNDDQFIQKNFFHQKFQVALVVDPIKKKYGFYAWGKNGLKLCTYFYLCSNVSRSKELFAYVCKNNKKSYTRFTNLRSVFIKLRYKKNVIIAVPVYSS